MSDLAVFKEFLNRQEAEIVQGLLKSKGVESVLIADDCGSHQPHLNFLKPGIKILVNPQDLPRAKENIENV
jgi:hypothetical protein